MKNLSYKSKFVRKEDVKKEWVVVDATNQVVGRLASKVAYILRGKHKPNFTPHVDNGDNVIIINAEKIRFTGKKFAEKEYIRYTGYPGGQRIATPKEWMQKNPAKILAHAIHGMLPKGRLGRKLNTNFRIFVGSQHNLQAQNPKFIDINSIK
ncbi:MAG: 50S ribosomal protein L13 [Bacteroidia bacterium]|nr:50S ribosomal protein L13 [Bacteroidia bacterium]